jgi:hypothetical protein
LSRLLRPALLLHRSVRRPEGKLNRRTIAKPESRL